MKRKLLALVLSLTMVFTMMPNMSSLTAQAASNDTQTTEQTAQTEQTSQPKKQGPARAYIIGNLIMSKCPNGNIQQLGERKLTAEESNQSGVVIQGDVIVIPTHDGTPTGGDISIGGDTHIIKDLSDN